jgi:hypothetical protein
MAFVGIYSDLGMVAPAFAQGNRTVAGGEKLGAPNCDNER